jgi:hypothetical protein
METVLAELGRVAGRILDDGKFLLTLGASTPSRRRSWRKRRGVPAG